MRVADLTDQKSSPEEKLNTLKYYFNMPPEDAPSLIFNYMPEVDQAGHRGGPDSSNVETALGVVDAFIGDLVSETETRNLTHIVDLIVLSDHGMTSLSKNRIIFLDDVLEKDFARIKHKDGWPSFGLHFDEEGDIEPVMERLWAASTGEKRMNFTTYTPATMPERWHFSHGPRIAPVYLVPDLGWILTDHVSRERSEREGRERQLVKFSVADRPGRVRALRTRQQDGEGVSWIR